MDRQSLEELLGLSAHQIRELKGHSFYGEAFAGLSRFENPESREALATIIKSFIQHNIREVSPKISLIETIDGIPAHFTEEFLKGISPVFEVTSDPRISFFAYRNSAKLISLISSEIFDKTLNFSTLLS